MSERILLEIVNQDNPSILIDSGHDHPEYPTDCTPTMEPRINKTEANYQAGMAALDVLMALDPNPATPESDRLVLRAMRLAHGEDRHSPMETADPLDARRFRMEPQGLKNPELEALIAAKPRVSARVPPSSSNAPHF